MFTRSSFRQKCPPLARGCAKDSSPSSAVNERLGRAVPEPGARPRRDQREWLPGRVHGPSLRPQVDDSNWSEEGYAVLGVGLALLLLTFALAEIVNALNGYSIDRSRVRLAARSVHRCVRDVLRRAELLPTFESDLLSSSPPGVAAGKLVATGKRFPGVEKRHPLAPQCPRQRGACPARPPLAGADHAGSLHDVKARKPNICTNLPEDAKCAIMLAFAAAGGQLFMGVTMLVNEVPTSLAMVHQGGAALVLGSSLWVVHSLRFARPDGLLGAAIATAASKVA
ncbi:hypothetical protein PF008_g8377 [Phytophthora fragariae]|uniref:Cytochrome oxidase assembly protein n=1 Tax=Phytophthora fragariae TaxID=53985 RepID=A0A6G0S1C0_9STRA|nr:hypothetical protein PF008_g8377 [Phytophthora fragariae]